MISLYTFDAWMQQVMFQTKCRCSLLMTMLKHFCEIFLRVIQVCGLYVEFFHKNLQSLWSHKPGKRRAKTDVSHSQMKEGQEDGYSLLLKPRNVEGQWKVIHGCAASCLGESNCHLDGGIRVVTLSHVEKTWEVGAWKLSKILVEQSVLSASKCEDHRRLRKHLGESRIVSAATLRAIAASNKEDVVELAFFDGIQDGGRRTERRLPTKAYQMLPCSIRPLLVFGSEATLLESAAHKRSEIAVL